MKSNVILNDLLVDLFNHILLLEEINLKKKGVKLTMNEVHVLDAIDKLEEPTMTNVAKKLLITQGTLTTSSNRLIKKGYIEKIKDLNDKRIYRLRLTNIGEQAIDVHDKFHKEMIDSLLLELNLDEDQILIKSLLNISDFFEKNYKA